MNGSASRIALVIATTCLMSFAAHAAPPVAPTPGQVQSTLPTQQQQPNRSQPAVISQPGPTPSGVAPGGPAVKVQAFDITGNAVISSDELREQIASYVGQTLTLSQLYDVVDVLTRYYRSQGYGLAYVSLPAQTLKGGTVKFQVVEGRIGKISITGNDHTRTAVLERRAAGLKSGDVYTDSAAERAVLLMNDLPGEQAHVVLSPGTDYGTSDLLFNVDETRYSGDTSIDDYGRDAIGRWRFNADANINSLTGSGDQLSAGITHAEANLLNFGKLGYMLPTGASSSLTASFNRAFYHVGGGDFASAGIEGSTQNSGLNWQDALVRTQTQSLYLGVGVTHNTSKNEAKGLVDVTTNITLLQLSLFYTKQREDQSYYSLSGNFWTNGKSNTDGTLNDAEKAHFQVDGTYVQPFAQTWEFIGQGTAAYSTDTLVDGDKYSLGGPGNVRGFQSAEARGDRGLFASGEFQRNFISNAKFPLGWGFFLDSGKVWTKSIGSGSGSIPGSNTTLTSVGTELQLLPSATGWNSRLQFAWAVGAHRPSDDGSGGDRGPHIWFTVGKTF